MPSDAPAVIIADPSASNCQALADMLGDLDCKLLQVQSGQAVMSLAAGHQTALVLMSLDIEEPDAYQVINRFSVEEEYADVPVVMLLSSFSDQRRELHGHLVSGADVIAKPVNQRTLRNVVSQCLAMYPLRLAVHSLKLEEEKLLDDEQGLIGTDEEGIIQYANPAALRMLRMRMDDVSGLYLESIFQRSNANVLSDWKHHRMARICRSGRVMHVKVSEFSALDGASLPVTYMAVSAPAGSGLSEILAFQYIGPDLEETEKEQALSRLDPLTGLPGRKRFELAVHNSISQTDARHPVLAVLFVDVDHFKYVNDTLGHDIGDTLLQQVAWRIQEVLGEHDLLARLGGDQFTVLLPNLGSAKFAAVAAGRILHSLELPFLIGGYEIFTGASIGIASYPHCGDTGSQLMRNAATAQDRAKSQGRNQFEFYTTEMNRQNVERMKLEVGLHHALERDELFLQYLPLVEPRSGRVAGFEALIRWRHPERGIVDPEDFIPIAEETGLIADITNWVLRRACEDYRIWSEDPQFAPDILLTINIPSSILSRSGFLHDLALVLNETGVQPSALQFDLNERMLASHLPECTETLVDLSKLGVRIALDDLGAGYSSLRYLRQIKLDAIKIDSVFISNLRRGSRDSFIVRSVITMARSLGIKTIAEGVETEEQLEFLRRKRCDLVQGFYYMEPLDHVQVIELLASGLGTSSSLNDDREN